jgi:hypothetical protein
MRYLYLLDNQNSCQSFNSWFFVPHHSDLYTETGLKVLTSKYKWAQKKGHIWPMVIFDHRLRGLRLRGLRRGVGHYRAKKEMNTE